MSKQKPLRNPRGFDTWLTVGRTNLKVHRTLNQLLGELDLSLAQHEILVTIRRHPNLTQRELAHRLHVIKSNATALLNKLEARGLITCGAAPATTSWTMRAPGRHRGSSRPTSCWLMSTSAALPLSAIC